MMTVDIRFLFLVVQYVRQWTGFLHCNDQQEIYPKTSGHFSGLSTANSDVHLCKTMLNTSEKCRDVPRYRETSGRWPVNATYMGIVVPCMKSRLCSLRRSRNPVIHRVTNDITASAPASNHGQSNHWSARSQQPLNQLLTVCAAARPSLHAAPSNSTFF